MIYTNSIEGYCNNPLSKAQVYSISQTLQERARRKIILLWAYAITSLVAVILVGVGAYFTASAQEAAGAVLSMLAASLFFGLLFRQTLHPYLSVTIKIAETDMATSTDFFNELPNPSVETLSSPMARQLVENIRRAGRNTLVFEQSLIGKLSKIHGLVAQPEVFLPGACERQGQNPWANNQGLRASITS